MEVEDAIKMVAGAFLGIVVLVLLAYFLVYVVVPVVALAAAYFLYSYYRDHPDTQARRLRQKADQLYKALPPPADFESFGAWEPIARELCGTAIVPAPPPAAAGAIELGRYVDRLSSLVAQPLSREVATRALGQCFQAFSDAIPTFEPGPFTTTARDVVANAGRTIEGMVSPFYDDELIKTGALSDLRAQLDRNVHRMSDVPYIPTNYESPKLIMPSRHKGTPAQIINGYLANTPLLRLFDDEIHFGIPPQLRFEGMWIVAPPGRGKTTLLSQFLERDLDEVAADQCSVILMDSKGDLIDHVKKLKRFTDDLDGRLVLIEPSPALALNPLDLGATAGHKIALLEYVFSGLLDTEPTPLQSTLFRAVLLAMEVIPNATFDTFRRFLQEGWRPFEQYLSKMHPDDQTFFLKGEFDSKTYAETKQQLLWRIRDLTTKVPLLRDMFKSPTTKIDIGKEMDAAKVIVIDNAVAKLSVGSEFFSRFFLALILSAAQQRAGRSDREKLPCYVYIDECDTVISNDQSVPSILHRCRSQKIGLILAHQEIQQIKSADVLGALSNCAVRIANSDEEAPELAPRLRTTPDVLRSLRRGQFALYMRDCTSHPLIIDVANHPVSAWPKMSARDYRRIEDEMRARYDYAPDRPEEPEPSEASETVASDNYQHSPRGHEAEANSDAAQEWR